LVCVTVKTTVKFESLQMVKLRFVRKEETLFRYVVNFTNTTATASFTFDGPVGVGDFTFSFHGKRLDGNSSIMDPLHEYRDYLPVSLADPADHVLPKFTFMNGTDIYWVEEEGKEWYPTIESNPPTEDEDDDDIYLESAALYLWQTSGAWGITVMVSFLWFLL
jgi:hypothetical protein